MTQLRIFDLNDIEDKQVIACLHNGVHIIGRGDLLNVPDKKVSRNHALIDVSESRVVVTPTHINPCFYRAANGSNLVVLDKDSETEISDGDQIGLLPDRYWFKLRIVRTTDDVSENNNITSSESITHKRPHEKEEEEPDENHSKKPKSSSNIEEPSASYLRHTTENNEEEEEALRQPEIDSTEVHNSDYEEEVEAACRQSEIIDTTELNNLNTDEVVIKEEDITGDEDALDTTNDNVNIAAPVTVKSENNDDSGPSSSSNAATAQNATTNGRREKCWYATSCYRKNHEHRAAFSHPGDPDYISGPNDNRPDCPYGAACYRTNSDHRKDYKHPTDRPAPRPSKPPQPMQINFSAGNFCAFCQHCQRSRGGKPGYERDPHWSDDDNIGGVF